MLTFFAHKCYDLVKALLKKKNVVHKPAVALEPGRIVNVLMKTPPSPSASTVSTDDGVRVTVNGFWFVIN